MPTFLITDNIITRIHQSRPSVHGLRIQLSQARTQAKVAQRTYALDIAQLSAGRLGIGQLAAQSYMNNGLDTTLSLLTTLIAMSTMPAMTTRLTTVKADTRARKRRPCGAWPVSLAERVVAVIILTFYKKGRANPNSGIIA